MASGKDPIRAVPEPVCYSGMRQIGMDIATHRSPGVAKAWSDGYPRACNDGRQ